MTDDQDKENLRSMERITFRCPKGLIEQLEKHVDRGTYPNRSEALRAAVRNEIDKRDGASSGPNYRR